MGFGWECKYQFIIGHNLDCQDVTEKYSNWNEDDLLWSAPELSLACKWLREVNNLHVNVLDLWYVNEVKYIYVFNVSYPDGTQYDDGMEEEIFLDTYESAQSAGLDVALNYLISN